MMDEIVAVTQYQDRIMIFTKYGTIYEMVYNTMTNLPTIRVIYRMELRP